MMTPMAKRISHDLTYDAPIEDVRAMLLDEEFRRTVATEQRALRSTVDIQGTKVHLETIQPAAGIPSFAKKFVGDEIVIDDPMADELLPLAAAQRAGHETAFISHEGVFGDLATDERFRRTFVEELDALRRNGARARLRSLAGRTRAA